MNVMHRQIPMHIVLKTYMFIGEHGLTKSKIYYALFHYIKLLKYLIQSYTALKDFCIKYEK